jgi:endo-1,4-beta-xylanase
MASSDPPSPCLSWSRRRALGLGVAAACVGGTTAQAGEISLGYLARTRGLVFGSAVGAGAQGAPNGSLHDARYRQILATECELLVPENELKWYVVRAQGPQAFDFGPADRIAAFAKSHGQALRGHTLLWHHPRWFPAWLESHDFGPRPAEAAATMVAEHINILCARYPQMISWDVVNETVDPDDGAIRRTVLSDAMGQEAVLDLAFHTARLAAPKARLVYNDYMSWDIGGGKHRDGVLKLLEGFKTRGAPVDALGLQSHIGADVRSAQEKVWRAFLDEVVAMGYDLLITEFDVDDRKLPPPQAQRDAAVAASAKAYLDLTLSYRQTREVLAWGMADKYSWLQNHEPRLDRLAKRPTPYDDDYRPKPLRRALADALRAAPSR